MSKPGVPPAAPAQPGIAEACRAALAAIEPRGVEALPLEVRQQAAQSVHVVTAAAHAVQPRRAQLRPVAPHDAAPRERSLEPDHRPRGRSVGGRAAAAAAAAANAAASTECSLLSAGRLPARSRPLPPLLERRVGLTVRLDAPAGGPPAANGRVAREQRARSHGVAQR